MEARKKRTRQETPSPLDDEPPSSRSRCDSNSNNETSAFEKMTEIMSSLFITTQNRSRGEVTKGEVVPFFNPEERQQTAEAWCSKVDELAQVFHWDEDQTIYFALSKLRGLAQIWYNGLVTIKHSWNEWKEKIKAAFPAKRDFYTILLEVAKRRKQPNETYSNYFYEMSALLNQCKITGPDAVSCIIGGIDDRLVKTTAKGGNHQTPESLLQYINTIADISTPSVEFVRTKHNQKKQLSFKPQRRQEFGGKIDKACFSCGKKGHYANVCRERKRCNFCRRVGHFEKDCYAKKKDSKDGNAVA